MFHITNIAQVAAENTNFRTVLFTGNKSQLVVMSIPAGEDIGEETHEYVEQILYFQSGQGKAIIDGKKIIVSPGDVLIVTPGTRHNVINTGQQPLAIATVYVPPNHIDGIVHRTKVDALKDIKDEAFRESA